MTASINPPPLIALALSRAKSRTLQVVRSIGPSIGYVLAVHRTPLADREGLTRPRWWRLPICWLRGHRYGRRGAFEIVPWRLEFCPCCGEEVAFRTRWSQLQERPGEDDLPWGDDYWEEEEDEL